jgi:hypothetical protein
MNVCVDCPFSALIGSGVQYERARADVHSNDELKRLLKDFVASFDAPRRAVGGQGQQSQEAGTPSAIAPSALAPQPPPAGATESGSRTDSNPNLNLNTTSN